MPEIKNVAILGAGAMGAHYAARFFESPGFSTALIAGGERADRLQRDGLVVNSRHYAIPVCRPEEAAAPADLILVALKHHHLSGAVDDLRGFVGPDTLLLSVMNGLDSEETLSAAYGAEKVLLAMSVGIDAVREGNRVVYSKPGTVYFGEADNTTLSARVRRVQAAFDRAGIAHHTPNDMVRWLWWKFMVNVGVNQASAVLRAPYRVFQTLPDAQAVMEALMREVIQVAQAAGVNLTEQDLTDWYGFLNSLSPDGKTSMLQDIEAGRKTEVELFAGKMAALGRQYAIPTPVNQTVLNMIHVLERNT